MTLAPPQAYQNGVFVPASQLSLSLNDQGCRWGAIVTERLRTYQRVPYRLEQHLTRFRRSCELAQVPLERSDERLEKVIGRLLVKNELTAEVMIVLLATPGKPGGPPTFIAHLEPLDRVRYARQLSEGVLLRTSSIRHAAADHLPPAIKHRSRLFWWLAEQEVKAQHPEATALLLNPNGYLTETAYANLLLVLDNKLCSPRHEDILPGTRLQLARELAATAGLEFVELDLTLDNARWAAEAIITTTPLGFAPVRQINDVTYPVPGRFFLKLRQAWTDSLGFDPYAEFTTGGQAASG